MTPSGQVEFFIFRSFFWEGTLPRFFTGGEAVYAVEAIISGHEKGTVVQENPVQRVGWSVGTR